MSDGEGVTATVSVTEPTGPEIHIYAELGGEEICAITDERRDLVARRHDRPQTSGSTASISSTPKAGKRSD